MEDVFIIHTRQHFKLTHHKLVSKRHPSSVLVYSIRTIGSSRSVALGIVAAFILPRGFAEKYEKMLWLRRQFFRKISSATTQHRGQALRPSGGTQGREHRSVGAQRRLCQHLLPSRSCTYHEKKPCFWRPCTYRPQHLPLPWRRPEGNAKSLWTDCECRFIRNNSTSIELFYLPFRYSSLCLQKTLQDCTI